METVLNGLLCVAQALFLWLQSVVLFFVPAKYREKSVSGDVALITGAGSGIGRLLALRLAKRGARIVTWDVNAEGNEETVRQIRAAGGEAHAYTCDLSNREVIYKTAERVKREVGKVTILVNNAGMVTGKPLLDIPDNLIEKTFEVNTLAHFWTCKAFLPDMMIAKKGHVVNIASLAGLQGMGRLTDYCASKFAAVGFHESLTVELKVGGHEGVKTTVICPFFINTGMFDGAKSNIIPFLEPEYVAERIEQAILLNEEQVLIPGYLAALFYLKLAMPWRAFWTLGLAFKVERAMDTFTGRTKQA
ncbi:epidermal retinol dehydrogenase 2-like isoform X2 [Amphibalanus amphitrite]|uniref:epidermal retinol dehydrogenase 2-like isoform X2 n=1 Tax=Amphibalanus amphitrite TaxID=1232801 RepID=UPI001C90BDF9|nr:epidermal retinol dehydrogenase 2-like isoform X2 [Amphibalanus amphitrite]